MENSPTQPAHQPRRKKLVAPGLQLRLVVRFAGLAVLAMLLQFGLLTFQLTRGATALGPHGAELAQEVPGLLLNVLGLTALIVVPLVFLVGVSLTHRFAGPVYRFEGYLRDVAAGKETQPLNLRGDDEMRELSDLITAATAEKRAENDASGTSTPARAAA